MADEGEIFRGLIGIQVDDGDAVAQISQLVQAIQEQIIRLGNLPAGSLGQGITSEFVKAGESVDVMLGKIQRLTQMLQGLPALSSLTRDLDLAAARLEQTGGQGYSARHLDPVAAAQAGAAAAVAAGPTLAEGPSSATLRANERLRASDARMEAEEAKLADTYALRARVQRESASQEEAIAARQARIAELQAQIDLRRQLGIGQGRGGGGPRSDAQNELQERINAKYKIPLQQEQSGLQADVQRLAELQRAEAAIEQEILDSRRRMEAEARRAETIQAQLGEIGEREKNAAERSAAAQEKAAAATAAKAAEAEVAAADPRRNFLATATSAQFNAVAGADPTLSLRGQSLQIERAKLEADLKVLQATAAEATSVEEIDKLVVQRANLERRILANSQAQISEAGRGDGGRSGFFNGLTGSFYGGGGGEGGGFGNLLFQAGQATKFYALYTTLSEVQRIMRETVTTAEEYTKAVNDLAIATNTSNEAAAQQAQTFAQVGQTFAASPLEATTGATKFIRSFRTDDTANAGLSQADIGEIGARVVSEVQVLEGKQNVDKVIGDLVGLTKSQGGGATQAEDVLGQLISVSQHYGVKTAEVASGTAVIGDIAETSGFSLPRAAALIASVMQAQNIGGEAAAGDIKRFLGSQATIDKVFERYNIGADEKFAQRLDKLGEVLATKSPSERESVLNSIGGSRIGSAVNVAIQTLPEQRAAAEAAGTGVGTAADQARRRLTETFSGAMEALKADVDGLMVAVVESGVADLGALVLRGLSDTLRTITGLVEAFNRIPAPLRDTIVGLGGLAAALAVVNGIQGAVAGSAAAQALKTALGVGAGAGVGADLAALQVQRGLAVAAADTAQVAALDAQIATTTVATGTTTTLAERLGVLGASAGRAAIAAAPLLTLLAGIAAIVVTYAEGQKLVDGVNQATGSAVRSSGAASAALDAGNVAAAHSELDQLKKSREEIAGSNEGFFNSTFFKLNDLNHISQRGPDLSQQRLDALAQIDARIKELQSGVDKVDQADKQLGDFSDVNVFFGKKFDQTAQGVQLITQRRVGIDAALRAAREEIDHLTSSTIGQFDEPQPGAQGIAGTFGAPELLKYSQQRIGRLTDPAAQQAALLQQMETFRANVAKAQEVGTPTDVQAAQELADEADKAYFDSLIKNTTAKINAIKAAKGVGGLDEVRALVSQELSEALKAGNINAVVAILDGADQAFIDTFRKGLQAQIGILQQQAAAIAAAAQAAASLNQVIEGSDSGAPKVRRLGVTGEGAFAGNAQQQKDAQAQIDALNAAQAFADPKGTDFKLPAGGPNGTATELARIQAQSVPGDTVSAAKTALDAANYQLQTASAEGDQQAYYTALKAVHQAQFDLAKAQRDQAIAASASGVRPGDAVAAAEQAVSAAQANLNGAVKGSTDYYTALKALNQAQYDLAKTRRDQAVAALGADASAADPLAQAQVAVAQAQATLGGTVTGSTEYYNAIKSLHQAQYALAKAENTAADALDIAGIDITDPVAQAQEKVRAAQRALGADQAAGAGAGALAADQNAIRQAQASAQSAAFSQQFSDEQTNYELHRTSLDSYLSYLRSQHDYLSAVGNKTRQQVDELNQVDRALKGLTEGLQGQFNLGQIKVPSPYEVRRAIAAGGPGVSSTTTTNVDIQINGADLQAVYGILGDYLGQPATQTGGTIVRKIGS